MYARKALLCAVFAYLLMKSASAAQPAMHIADIGKLREMPAATMASVRDFWLDGVTMPEIGGGAYTYLTGPEMASRGISSADSFIVVKPVDAPDIAASGGLVRVGVVLKGAAQTPLMYGAVCNGDGVTNDVAALRIWANTTQYTFKALPAGNVCQIADSFLPISRTGRFEIDGTLAKIGSPQKDNHCLIEVSGTASVSFKGHGGVLDGGVPPSSKGTLRYGGGLICTFASITGLRIAGLTLRNSYGSCISARPGAVIEANTFKSCGTAAMGPFAYSDGGDGIVIYSTPDHGAAAPTIIQGNDISGTYGQGGIFYVDVENIVQRNNHIHNVYWAGVRYFQLDQQFITKNNTMSGDVIDDIGSLNTGSSAVGNNGIYVSQARPADVSQFTLDNETISNVGENCIEGAVTIRHSSCTNTRFYGKTTPSDECFFSDGQLVITDSVARGCAGPAVKMFQTASSSGSLISANDFQVANPATTPAIKVQPVGRATVTKNLTVSNNKLNSGIYLITSGDGSSFDPASVTLVGNQIHSTKGAVTSRIEPRLAHRSGNSFDRPEAK